MDRSRQAGVNARTAAGYDEALHSLGIVDSLPAWGSNRRNHLYAERAKRHFEDAGLAAAVAGLTPDDVYAESDLRGRIIDTFVTAQLRVEADASTRLDCSTCGREGASTRSTWWLRSDAA